MIQKGSYIIPTDKNGVWNVCVFHIFGGFQKKYGKSGSFLKTSVKKLRNKKWLYKKAKISAILIQTKYFIKKNDEFYLKFKINSCILLKKRLTPIGKLINGPSIFSLKRKKFIYSFLGTL